MDYSYEEIEKYILDYEIEGSKLFCEFQNEHGEVFTGTSNIKETKSIQSKVAKRAERMIKSTARRNASRLVRTAFGGGMIGRLGSSIARQSVDEVEIRPEKKNYSEENIREAITKSFRRVARNFEIGKRRSGSSSPAGRRNPTRSSERSGRGSRVDGTSMEEMSFQEQIESFPIKNMFERDIMSRILVQIADADGKITEDERTFILELLPKKFGTIAEIKQRGDISKIEAEEINGGVKKTIMLLAWSVALVDFDLDNAEESRLNEYASLLGFDFHESNSIAKMAKQQTLIGIMEPYMDRQELINYAERIELTGEEAERMFIQYKKSL